MSVLISGVLMNPAGVPVSGAEVTFSALTNGPSVLNGFSASVITDQDGNYSIPLEICEYAISIQSDGYNSVYGSVSINEKSTPATINELLKRAAMEQAITPAIIVYFREIQTDVAAKLATMQTLGTNAAEAASAAVVARNEVAQYAQNLSAAVAQAQQASAAATASANAATTAKNAAETAVGNAQATLANAMLKGEFGWGGSAIVIPSSENVLTYFSQPRASGVYSGLGNVGGPSSPSGVFDSGKYEWILGYLDRYGTLRFTSYNQPFYSATNILDNGTWRGWVLDWNNVSLPNPMTTNTAQNISAIKTFTENPKLVRSAFPGIVLENTSVALGTVGREVSILLETANLLRLYIRNGQNTTGQRLINIPLNGTGAVLVSGVNAIPDSGGFYKTASPVINIYADGSFTTTDEAAGVDVERLSEGVYKITGCHGMHPDAAWNGIDGGVSNPKCRNDKALLWNNYEVDEDGSVTIYTFHRVHPDAMPFAQNRLTLDKEPFDPKKHDINKTWPDQSPIDVPHGLYIQVRVNMPERTEPKPSVMSSNVYCNNISLV
ncbi:prophage tail fiber N-terminal domain-containing protein [Pectobacterium versatile]|uniref:phage tail fiber protein n=1 Tax=Pectobacterium versatile TaxID=2488639 RepID=UPI00301AE1F4